MADVNCKKCGSIGRNRGYGLCGACYTSWRILDPQFRARKNELNKEWYHRHREERNASSRASHKKNAERIKFYRIFKKYGISKEEYLALLLSQSGKCAICKNIGIKLNIDHCHKTGRVRGLLCNNCNTALGLLKEDVRIFRRSITYLKTSIERKESYGRS